ncbi:MAG: DNRLRE domain-containing protein [Actinomycetota bacterium]
MKKILLLGVVATIAIGTATGFAATLSVGSNHLWAGTQSLTKATCTLTGTTQSVDTYVNQASANTSYGTTTTMLVQPNSGSEKRALITFDLSKCSPTIPTTGGADTATLALHVTSAPTRSRTLTLWRATSSWSSTSTWNTQPSLASSSTTTFASGTTASTINVPVTVDADDIIKGSTNYGWVVTDEGSTAAGDTTTFATSNSTTNKPVLTINYEK